MNPALYLFPLWCFLQEDQKVSRPAPVAIAAMPASLSTSAVTTTLVSKKIYY